MRPAESGSSPTEDGSEPINFRAALAAFQNNASPATSGGPMHAPVARAPRALKPKVAMPLGIRETSGAEPVERPTWWGSTPGREDVSRSAASDDPVPRSNSTPRIRTHSVGTTDASTNPFAQDPSPAPAGSSHGSPGLLRAQWPSIQASEDATSRLRKTGSGTSLRDLTQKSLPDAQSRNRSKSLASRSAGSLGASGRSTPNAGTGPSSPRLGVRNIIALYGGSNGTAMPEGATVGATAAAIGGSRAFAGPNEHVSTYGGALRTSSPMSFSSTASLRNRHMLDLSNDEQRHDPLFGHAVMEPRPRSSSGLRSMPVSHPSSPQGTGDTASISSATAALPPSAHTKPSFKRTISSSSAMNLRSAPLRDSRQLPSPPHSASRSPTTSSTYSAGPRLPPRPSGVALAAQVSEFGQITDTPASASAGDGPFEDMQPFTYATYTPGVRRQGPGLANAFANNSENGRAPPALPPRGATVGQASLLRLDLYSGPLSSDEGHPTDPYGSRASIARAVPQSTSIQSRTGSSPSGARPERPEPPPRPRATQPVDGNAGGFRFGGTDASSDPFAAGVAAPPPPVRARAAPTGHNRGNLRGLGSDPTPAATPSTSSLVGVRDTTSSHAKTSSNVFTSISLSDDASRELRNSLESDTFQHQQQQHDAGYGVSRTANDGSAMPPPPPKRFGHSTNRSIGSAMGITSSPNLGQLAAGKSLWESASSALPLPFKASASSGSTGRSLAEGSPSRQYQYVARPSAAVDPALAGRPGEVDNAIRPGWAGQLHTRPVTLVPPVAKATARSLPPSDAAARMRYELLYTNCLQAQGAARARKAASSESEARDSGSVRLKRPSPARANLLDVSVGSQSRSVSPLSTHSVPNGDRDVSSGISVEAMKGWFESDTASALRGSNDPSHSPPTSRSAPSAPLAMQTAEYREHRGSSLLSMNRVRKVWQRSRLPDKVLAEIWDAATAFQRNGEGSGVAARQNGLTKEAFVRAMAAIDAELSRRAIKRRARLLRQGSGAAAAAQRQKSRVLHGGASPYGRQGEGADATLSSSSVHSTRSRLGDRSSPSLKHAPPVAAPSMGQRRTSDDSDHSQGSGQVRPTANGGSTPRRVPPPPVSRSSDP